MECAEMRGLWDTEVESQAGARMVSVPSGVTAERGLTVGATYGRVGREHRSEEESPSPARQLGHRKGLSLDHWFSSGQGVG